MNPQPDTTGRERTAPRARKSRFKRWLLVGIALVALAIAAAVAFVASEFAVAAAARILIARSDGRLAIEGTSGSLLSLVRIEHLEWHGPASTLTADDIAVDWNPLALWSRGIVVKALGAKRIALAIQPSDTATPLPETLALPTTVTIGEIAVAQFQWTIGTNGGRITGVTFGYQGGAVSHRVERVSLVLPSGTLTGSASVGAQPPFAVSGAFAFDGDLQQKRARADIALAGTIDAVALDASGRAGEAQFALRGRLTPFAAVAVEQLALDAHDLDLAAWDAALPATRLDVQAEGRPANGGIAGRFDAQNAIAGPLDAHRIPVRSVAARFAWAPDVFVLDDLAATSTRGGRVTGNARVPLGGGAGTWKVDLYDIDLRELYSTLSPTRLSGSLAADLTSARQSFEGRMADRSIVGGISATFAATLVDRKLSVRRFQILARDGELAGSGAIELADRRAFEVNASAKRVDPSRFGKFPAGRIDGEIVATGELEPSWRVSAKVAIGSESRLAGVALAGRVNATLAPRTLREAVIDLTLASAHLTASGSFGAEADTLTLAFDAPRIAELAPLLPGRAPKPLAGALRVDAVLRGDRERGGLDLRAHGEALKIGAELAVGSFDAHASVAAAATADRNSLQLGDRQMHIELSATGLVARPGTFARARASVDGTLAQHKASLSFAGEDLDVEASAHGGLRESRDPAASMWTWTGFVDTLENRAPWALHLDAPAALEVAGDHVHVGEARLRVADGDVALGAFAWDDGRITTRGSLTGVPVATVAKLGGLELPFASTLTLGGEWSLAAAPRLNGSVTVRREQGDLAFGGDSGLSAADRAFRITSAEIAARFTDDAVDATASIRSERGLNADAKLEIGSVADAPPGRLAPNAPLRLALNADLTTLKVLQPLIGTTAVVDGRAHAELVAHGTLAHAPWSGLVRADAMRVEAPQYGLLFTDGRMVARLSEGKVTLDELAFVGGSGRFTASGTLATAGALTGDVEGSAAQVTWRAEKFRVLNRPDLRLVVDGSGTIGLRNRKISLDGALVADEGHFEYKPDVSATLGDDVVVKGWETRASSQARRPNLPLSIDLDIDFGRNLTFVGEGLETGLRGKVRVTTGEDGTLRGRGSIQTINGTYYAFGQRLVIDRGRLIFDGPLDNPGLDIVALRKNLAVEAGVAVSGTVKVPIVQLTSNPPVPDNEKLSWLVLGQGVGTTSSADMAAIQAASAALLGSGGKPVTMSIAQSIGLDEISVGRSSSAAYTATGSSSDTANQVVMFGKRISDRLTLVYEQGLSVAKNALRLEYSLTRTLTLRVEAGAISSLGIYYRRVFD